MLIHDNIDQIVAVFLLVIVVLTVTFVFARNIIAQARKNAKVRAIRREKQKIADEKAKQSSRMWTMLDQY